MRAFAVAITILTVVSASAIPYGAEPTLDQHKQVIVPDSKPLPNRDPYKSNLERNGDLVVAGSSEDAHNNEHEAFSSLARKKAELENKLNKLQDQNHQNYINKPLDSKTWEDSPDKISQELTKTKDSIEKVNTEYVEHLRSNPKQLERILKQFDDIKKPIQETSDKLDVFRKRFLSVDGLVEMKRGLDDVASVKEGENWLEQRYKLNEEIAKAVKVLNIIPDAALNYNQINEMRDAHTLELGKESNEKLQDKTESIDNLISLIEKHWEDSNTRIDYLDAATTQDKNLNKNNDRGHKSVPENQVIPLPKEGEFGKTVRAAAEYLKNVEQEYLERLGSFFGWLNDGV